MPEQNIIVGYQGAENSNNHAAAIHFAEKYAWPGAELRPLVSGRNVVKALQAGEIQYGVYAYSTDVAGLVQENAEATAGVPLTIVDTFSIDIHHNLFKKHTSVPNESITAIASHPEALRECQRTVHALYPDAEDIAVQNTAVAARALCEGELPETTAVLCSLKAGAQFHLALIQANVEDLEHNGTTFALVTLAE